MDLFAALASAQERERCCIAMSNLFVDHLTDYRGVAAALVRYCPNIPLAECRRTFYGEAPPALGLNLLASVPPVWAAFLAMKW